MLRSSLGRLLEMDLKDRGAGHLRRLLGGDELHRVGLFAGAADAALRFGGVRDAHARVAAWEKAGAEGFHGVTPTKAINCEPMNSVYAGGIASRSSSHVIHSQPSVSIPIASAACRSDDGLRSSVPSLRVNKRLPSNLP